MTKIVLATGNPGKVREFNSLLSGLDFDIVPQSVFAIPEVEETGQTFVENAILKARHAAKHTDLPALADDSGLVVDALQGAPGIHSARYAGIHAADQDNVNKLLAELRNIFDPYRNARFHCVVVFLRHAADPIPLICQGIWPGRIAHAPSGTGGFGYDPVFFVSSEGRTAAELPPEIKNRLSHRGQALNRLLQILPQSLDQEFNRRADDNNYQGLR